jgi:ATP-dependent protease Clp ATPase subunit
MDAFSCSFCGKTDREVLLVQGPAVSICAECVEVCVYAVQSIKEESFRLLAFQWYKGASRRRVAKRIRASRGAE